MILVDTSHGVADGPGNTGSRAFRGGTRAPIATAEPDRTGQLGDQEVAFAYRLYDTLVIPHGPRFLNVLLDLDESSTVCLPGLRIDQHARIQGRGES
jgi:hypothetical protein